MNGFDRRALLAALGALAAAGPARAQTGGWPSGPIRIVVPFAPGGSTDATARLVAPGLQQRLGVPVLVENRSGAAGSIGADMVAKARPDGQTWLLTFDSHAVIPALLRNPPFDVLRDLDPVMLIGGAPYVVATRADRPFRALGDVLEAARARPEGVSFASTGNGTIGHLTMMLLMDRAGVRMQHVPYRSGGLAVNDAVAGHVDMMIGSAALVMPHVAGGTLRPLVQFGPSRLPGLAAVPTAEEQGFPGLVAEAWWAVFAPAGTPPPIIARFNAALRESLREERVRRQMEEAQQARLVLSSPEELRSFFAREVEIWGRVVRENNIQAD
ncbi:tripartite tricarboxylate transporter substrate binding protein [Crenalkalicoccus roseus]|uniref:tripartite tricarboxylate transporter substrate binding protein n=1 Tax=Crenalkalicoccus roseus TaxID=1485588 RepID=UPI0010808722|nr:tripartite tricarboxylate transporter substrate binding protein [Crenalkalicoccus roseus]